MVGAKALAMLVEAGADVRVTDIDPEKVAAAVAAHGVRAVEPDAIYGQDVDVFAPYALGAVINDDTIPQLKAKVVAGAAKNILADDRHGDELIDRERLRRRLHRRLGETIFDTDRYRKGGLQRERAMANVRRVGDRMRETFAIADADGLAYHRAADRVAERRIEALNHVRLLDRPDTAHYEGAEVMSAPVDTGVELRQVIGADGEVPDGYEPALSDEQLRGALRSMLLSRAFDARCFSLQRQGRLGTFSTVEGEEAAVIGSALALDPAATG